MYLSDRIAARASLFPTGGAIPPERRAVHITDLRTFLQCRRKWDFESLLRRALQPAILPAPLFLGQGVHIGVDHGYRESFGLEQRMHFDVERAVRVFRRWARKRLAQLEEHAGALWPDEAQKFNDLVELGTVMLTHYGLWAAKVDGQFRVLGLEHRFCIPVPGSPTVNYEGRFDGLVQHIQSNEIYVMEFKTSAYMTNDKLSQIYRDLQTIAYHWAAEQVYHQPVAGVLYRVLWKRIPDIPHMTSKGRFSYDKRQKMTEVWLDHCLDLMACEVEDGESSVPIERVESRRAELEQSSYDLRQMIREQGVPFFIQQLIRRSKRQQQELVRVLRVIGGEMVSPGTLVFPMSGAPCAWCRFKDPCDLLQAGREDLAEDLLQVEYAARTYWEDYDD